MKTTRTLPGVVLTLAAILAITGCTTTLDWDSAGSTATGDPTPEATQSSPAPDPTDTPEPTGDPTVVDAWDLEVGDCINIPSGDEFADVEKVPCDALHDAEVYLNYDSALASYDEDAIYDEAETACADGFRLYVAYDPCTSKYFFNYFTPLSESWANGDRAVTCIAYELDASGQDVVPRVGTIKGAGE